ncbi:ABC transporter permease [Celeribacter persicus]|jgi:ABC-type spermidine/putrescine transport system, permease component II|uniref:Spermidine/putrescine transport system permease protein n=1 Tax=Celeribacter persicus TaxID=1651082 RepID=A0A2T5HCM3_9RHOB|nr:ABC transporter permease [Celeribacter persicus]PTQ69309.1 spermidine/putrescine transport system permease protein [Celeribacter persicus]
MNRNTIFGGAYALAFFSFLFGPLIIMALTAFNSSRFPRVAPWECFTTNWFGELFGNARLMEGLMNSVIIGLGVVALAVPIGLAGALALSELPSKLRSTLYTVLILPILIPGVVLGISTIVLWGQISRGIGAGFLYNGYFLTIVGQITFVSAYAMLVFIARLQRFDATQTEAALDLGATPGQAFRKILLPFMAPAIGSAAFITLLASFENYNTTVFTVLSESTFTTALASKVRHGTDPSLSALAVIIITLTLIGALTNEAFQRRKEAEAGGRASRSPLYANPITRALTHPGVVFAILVAVIGGITYAGSQYDSSQCEAAILQEKLDRQEALRAEQRARIEAQEAEQGVTVPKPDSAFGGAFGGVGTSAPAAPAPKVENNSAFGGAFGGIAPPQTEE